MANIGTITINGYRFYNGGWSSSYRSLASSYSRSGSYCTVDRIVLPSFTSSQYSSYTIKYTISLITAGGTNYGTLYGYLCSSDPASGTPSQTPHISYIGSGSVSYSGLTANHQYFTLPITINNSLTSGGTYYLWLQTSNIAQLHYGGKVSATLEGTVATYTNQISHWAWGFKNSEGNNGAKNAFNIAITTFTKTYGNSIYYTASNATTIPNGFYLANTFGSSSYTSDGSWTSYNMGTYLTQPAKATYVEYDYSPTTYTITYNLNGGTNNSANPSTYNVLYGVTFSNPTRSGYTFLRWTINGSTVTGINPGANATFSSADDMYSKLKSRTTGNVTVTAVWKQNTYQVNYYTNYPNATSQTLFGTTAHNVGEPASMINAVPVRTGYVFKGWSKSTAATVPSYFSNSSTDITTATTVYAVWWPKFTWMNYDYEEWATMVQNSNNYLGTSIKVPDSRYYATEYNTIINAIKKYYLHAVTTMAAGSLIKKTHCTALATAWNAINSGYAYGG